MKPVQFRKPGNWLGIIALMLFHTLTFGMFQSGHRAGPLALIKLSAIGITSISGKTDGQIFANSGRGRYVKNFTDPTNPQTSPQQAVRSIFAAIAQRWRQLTQADRNAWNAAAPDFPIINRLGEVVELSGQMLYQQLNLNRRTIGETFIDSPPAPVGAQEILVDNLDADTSGGTYTLTMDQNIDANNKLIVAATAGLSAGVNNPTTNYRQIAILDSTSLDPIAFDIDLSAEYAAVFGALPVAGTKSFIRAIPVRISTGERGTPSSDPSIAS